MSDWLLKVIRAEADRLIELARDDAELRADLRSLAERILEATADVLGESNPAPADEPLRELTLGRGPLPPSPAPGPSAARAVREDDRDRVAALAARCQRKADRLRAGTGEEPPPGTSPADEDPAWLQRLIDGFCWTSRESALGLGLEEWREQLAGCFEAVAAALELAGRGRASARSLELLAEAQSALRRCLQHPGVSDDDQLDVYEWLRAEAARRRVFLRRYMRADDLADPGGWASLLDRIEEAASTAEEPRAARRSGPSPAPAATSPEVAEVAARLAGRSVVLIGGLRRPEAEEALRQAFRLESVSWIATREHESYTGFEPLIARPEVAVVLLAIRWSSHGFGEVRQLCDRHGKPLVRLPGGYGPNQVAAQILAQCSERLPPPGPASP